MIACVFCYSFVLGFHIVFCNVFVFVYIFVLCFVGRYCFMCFWKSNEKSYAKFFDKMSGKYLNNIAWMNCGPLGDAFQDSMLLYEFNATPCVVICFNGKTSNKHRYILGDTQESREQLKTYADECNVEEE